MHPEDQEVPYLTRAADLLEQIDLINPLIALNKDDPQMRDQFVARKQQFMSELSAILRENELLDGGLTAA